MKNKRTKHKASAPPADQTLESMSTLATGMADDFNNILTTVMGACSLIDKDDPANCDLHQCVELIRASAEHAAALSVSLMRVGSLDQKDSHSEDHPRDSASAATSSRDKKNIDGIVSSNNQPGGVKS